MPDMGDVLGTGEDDTARGEDEWKEETSAVERVIDVALTLKRPQTAGQIADEAAVAEQTARDHLKSLADLGVIAKTTVSGITKYQLDQAYLRFKEISTYVERFEKDELMTELGEVRSSMEKTRERFEVETPDQLRAKAADEEVPIEEISELKIAASEWETLEHRRDILEEAIERYDEFCRDVAVA